MDLQQSISDITDVSLILTGGVLSSNEAKNKNMVMSPISLHVVLSLIAAGSSGSTRDQLLSFLKSDSPDHLNKLCSELVSLLFAYGSAIGGPKLSYANGVWVDQTLPLKHTFKQVADHLYKADSNQAIEVVADVNSWAEKHTSGLIKELLSPDSVDNQTRLILANAIYFKGSWYKKFDEFLTKEDDFYMLNGSSVKVPFMTTKKKQYIRAFNGFKVLGLPYKQGEDERRFSMYFFLPDAKDGLLALVHKLSSQPGFLNEHLPFGKVVVGDFKLPKFKISFGFEASDILKGLGLELPFMEGGLTELTDSPQGKKLYVSSINQKSFIEINEEGTEAAAATAGKMRLMCLKRYKTLDFVADHPFMFLIKENVTGAVLFSGHVVNPLES
uniref:Serpin domain-containing protein n=1 Tax=Chenopodium quinoa TaxID=63459 RepID=A0A803MGK5_CHEQI